MLEEEGGYKMARDTMREEDVGGTMGHDGEGRRKEGAREDGGRMREEKGGG